MKPSTTPTGDQALSFQYPLMRSPLDFLFPQEEVECFGNRIGALAQLLRQIALADDYVSSWVR